MRIADGIGSADNRELSLSVGGNVLAYRSARTPVTEELLWMDRRGEVIQVLPGAGSAGQNGFALSPDNAAVVVARRSEGVDRSELWLLDLVRGASMRLTFDRGDAENPLWAPDGRRLAFTSRVESETEIRSIAPNASNSEMLLKSPFDVVLDSWSPGTAVFWPIRCHRKADLVSGCCNWKATIRRGLS